MENEPIMYDEQNLYDIQEMAAKLAGTIIGGMNNAQKCGLDISDEVEQIQKLSGKERHEKLMDYIMNSKDVSLQEIVDLSERAESGYEARQEREKDRAIEIQNAKTDNTVKLLRVGAEVLSGLSLGAAVYFLIFTPTGKRVLTTFLKAA